MEVDILLSNELYGALAGIHIEEGADKFAYRRGLFVLGSGEGMIKILNDEDFKPKNFEEPSYYILRVESSHAILSKKILVCLERS